MLKQYDDLKFYIRENTLDDFVIRETKSYLKKITLDKNDIWLDAGSNIGAFAMRISNQVNKIIALEPCPENFSIIKKNLKINNIKNVISIKKAIVGNNDKIRDFFLNNKTNKGTHSFLVKRGRNKIAVNCININELIKKYNINKIKIDVEGAEEEIIFAINDFTNIIEIIAEFHIAVLRDKKHIKYHNFISHLTNNNFNVDFKDNPKGAWTAIIYAKKI